MDGANCAATKETKTEPRETRVILMLVEQRQEEAAD